MMIVHFTIYLRLLFILFNDDIFINYRNQSFLLHFNRLNSISTYSLDDNCERYNSENDEKYQLNGNTRCVTIDCVLVVQFILFIH